MPGVGPIQSTARASKPRHRRIQEQRANHPGTRPRRWRDSGPMSRPVLAVCASCADLARTEPGASLLSDSAEARRRYRLRSREPHPRGLGAARFAKSRGKPPRFVAWIDRRGRPPTKTWQVIYSAQLGKGAARCRASHVASTATRGTSTRSPNSSGVNPCAALAPLSLERRSR